MQIADLLLSDGGKRVDRVKPRVEQDILLVLKVGSALSAERISVVNAVQRLDKCGSTRQDIVVLVAKIINVGIKSVSGSYLIFCSGSRLECGLMKGTQSAQQKVASVEA